MHHPLLTLTQVATPEAAIALQQELRTSVVMQDAFGVVQTVAGVDVGFEDDDQVACAAIAVLRFPDLKVQESVMIRRPTTFPYIPGLLAFREVPVVMEALAELKTKPDLLLFKQSYRSLTCVCCVMRQPITQPFLLSNPLLSEEKKLPERSQLLLQLTIFRSHTP